MRRPRPTKPVRRWNRTSLTQRQSRTHRSNPRRDTEPPPPDAPSEPAQAQPIEIVSETITGPTLFEVEETYEPATEPTAGSEPPTLDVPIEVYEAEPSIDAFAEADAGDAVETGDEPSETGDYAMSAEPIPEQPPPETVGGESDNGEEAHERRIPSRFLRNYKIQEVIKRRQILLVQVVKEERGTKGAALTTYLSLAGRFGVLMPNSPRGGGISRKITSATDRRRLKEVMAELEIPQGMGLIVRTAGANRPKPEIKRDCEYLLRLWDDIREHTLKSVAPALIYEEASLIKRAIRDVYSRDIDEIQVDGEEGWHAAHEFMRMLMPSHAKKVQLWRNGGQPLFAKHQVEAQLDAMLLPTAQLRSGGYLVINQAEALVAIDVNSGRSTRERGIEETALRTNLEAADEVARQLRLRDLAGLIVIDFIDMESTQAQRDGREAPERGAEERPRAHPGRPHQPFRPDGNEPPAAAPVARRNQLHRLPALRWHRPRALDRERRDACIARHRGRRRQAPRRRDRRARRATGRAVYTQPQARAAGGNRNSLRHARALPRRRYPDDVAIPHRPRPRAGAKRGTGRDHPRGRPALPVSRRDRAGRGNRRRGRRGCRRCGRGEPPRPRRNRGRG